MNQYKKIIPPWLGLVLGDIVILNAANILAFWLRFNFQTPAYNFLAFRRVFPWDTGILLITFYLYGLYDRATHKTSHEVVSSVITAIIANGFFSAISIFLLVAIGFPRSVFVISVALQMVLFLVWRLGYRSWSLRTAPSVDVLVVAPQSEWPDLAVRAGKYLPRIELTYTQPDDPLYVVPWQTIGAVMLGSLDEKVKTTYFLECMKKNIPCLWKPDTYDLLVAGSELTSLGEAPMFSLASIRTRHGAASMKRVADVVISGLGLLLGFPIFLLLAILIIRDSGRPVFYRQERITAGGRPFMLLKFRTMVQNAEEITGPVLASRDDPRITPLGRLFRTAHIDELPQLWNVFKGDMSLVGPRPERPIFVDQHRQNIAFYELRHLSTPGLTGLAQVSGSYMSSPEEKATYDLHYAKSWSWFKDLAILIKTLVQLSFKKDE
jgi:exopolysaccharide biosynthesis polyprenyl glycosylphosphotransferase